jgi:hypothetical protein
VNSYEIVVKFNKENNNNNIKYMFKYNENEDIKSNIVNFIVEYFKTSCIKEAEYPENFPYKELPNISDIEGILRDEIIGQIVNSFKKVEYLLTKKGILIPIKETGITNKYKQYTIDVLRRHNKLRNLKATIKGINNINKILTKEFKINIIGISIDKNVQPTQSTGIFTDFGVFIPVKYEEYQPIDGIPELDFKYYENANQSILNGETENEENKYNDMMESVRNQIYETKKELGSKIVNDEYMKEQIIRITKQTDMKRFDKITKLKDLLKSKLNTSTDFILSQICNDILNDNVENLLLNNIILKDDVKPDDINKKDDESILFNINDITQWIKKYETD